MKTNTLATLCAPLLPLLIACGLAAAAGPELRDLRFTAVSSGTEKVVLQLNGPYSPKVFTMKDETPRIVLDFADMAHSRKVSPVTEVNGAMVKRIRVGVHPGASPKTRVVLDLATFKGVSYDQRFDPATSTLTIELTGNGAAPSPPTAAAAKSGPAIKKSEAAVKAAPAVAAKKTPAPADKGTAPAATPPAATEKKGAATDAPLQTAAAPARATGDGQPTAAAAVADQAKPPAAMQPQAKTDEKAKPAAGQAAQTAATPSPQPAKSDQTAPTETAATAAGSPDTTAAPDKPAPTVAQAPPPPATGQTPSTPATEAAPTAEDKAAAPTGPMLEAVTFDAKSPKGEMVMFKLNQFHPPEVRGVEEGIPRVICDFKETGLADTAKNLIKTDGQHVKVIRISKTRNPEKVRVVLDLVPNRSYDLQQVFFKEDNLFVIIVNTMKP